jgi:cytoskeletal protein RodZ
VSKESFSERFRDPEQRTDSIHKMEDYGRRNRQPLIVGVVLGLLLGLFIGWVAWPVQWDNSWPPDLADEARADYIAAVADAFVAARSDDAAEIAYQRLSSFGDSMADQLDWAQSYFQDNETSDSPLRINNIQELAASIQPVATPKPQAEAIEIDAEEADAEEGDLPADLTDESEAEEGEGGIVPPDSTGSSDWLRLALWLVAAFILIAGGIWVLRALVGPQPEPTESHEDDEDDIDEFTEEDLDELNLDQPHEDVVEPETSGAAGGAFVAKDLQATDRTEQSELQSPRDSNDAAMGSGEENPSISVRAGTAGTTPDSNYYEDQEGYGFVPETDLPEGGGSKTVIVDAALEPAVDDQQGTSETRSDQASASQAESATESVSTPDFLASGREVARYTATYYPMPDEYEEAFRIVDVGTGDEGENYIGDCGMGVNMKYGFVQHNPEHVAALDVWLIDLVQEGAMSFHAQTFVSKYGAAHALDNDDEGADVGVDEATEDAQSTELVKPAEAGDRFQIVGENLLIDGEVMNASYMKDGPAAGVFQGFEVSLVVSRRL